jgi:hypothetical protein
MKLSKVPAPSVWDKLHQQMKGAGIAPRTKEARLWYGQVINRVQIATNRSNILNDPRKATAHALIGRMYTYHYRPKGEETLPMWDQFPIVLPMEIYPDGFLGLNLHYLDPGARLALLQMLHDFITNDKYDNSTRFKLSYSVLNGIKRYEIMRPCIKRYLIEYMESPMIYIEPDEWELAVLLPFERFHYNT